MMEVSQNMELKELSTEGALLRNLSSDLSSEVEPVSTPAIVNESSRTSADEDDLCELANGVDSKDIKDIDKPITGSEQERDAGSDLDALLDKISSIVDCSPRNPDDLESLDKNEECDSASTKEKPADETDEKQVEQIELETEEEEGEGEVSESKENEARVELDSEIETEDKAAVEDIEHIEDPAPTKETTEQIDDLDEPDEENLEEVTEEKKKSEEKEEAKPHDVNNTEKVRTKVNSSADDVFLDALDSISSSDEFDAIASKESEKAKQSKNLNTENKSDSNDLEEISSDDDDILKDEKVDKPEKPKADIIDLDSSGECVICETPTDVEESVDKTEDTEEVTPEKGSSQETKIVEENISEEPVDVAQDEPIQAEEEEEKITDIEDPTESMSVEDEEPKVTKEPKQTEEPKETEEPKVTGEKEESVLIEDGEPMLVDKEDEESKKAELQEVQEDKQTEEPEKAKEVEEPEEVKEAEELVVVPEKVTEEVEEVNLTEEAKETEAPEEANPKEKSEKKAVEPDEQEETKEPEDKEEKEEPEEAKPSEQEKEPVVVECEATEDPKKSDQVEEEFRTQTQEMNDTAIDDLLMEADKDTLESEEKKASEVEPIVISEDDKEPKVNGICEMPTDDNKEPLAKEKPVVEKEAKEPESDDEVIFFEPLDKTNKIETATEPTNEQSKKLEAKDDEVVLVSEDEDEEPQENKLEKEVQSSVKETTTKGLPNDSTAESVEDKDLQMDNSDNACDQFEKLKTPKKVKSTAIEDGNSNSSNLLRPAEDSEESAPKRVRLSTDEKIEPVLEAELEATTKSSSAEEDKKDITKRSHDHLDSSPDRENEIPNKKPKTEDSEDSCDGTLQIDMEGEDDKVHIKKADSPKKEEVEKPKIDLTPAPETKKDIKPLRLEFFKAFRRSIDTMTRDDLEELVLQKVVEAMLVKSDFADIRLQLDKCENTLTAYRRKIAEVSKQFLDLETVHKRVLKDLEAKNSHYTAPVRITRAVGLQVGIPFKAMKPTVAAPEQSHAAGSMLAPPSGTPPKASTSPMRSPMRSRPPPPTFGSSSSSIGSGPGPSGTPSPNLHQQPARSTANSSQSPAAAGTATPPVRRGCLQKVTPQRPGPGNNLPVPQTNNQSNVHRMQTSPPGGQRTMHASKHTGTTASMAASVAKAAMRNRNSAPAYVSQKQQQQQQQQQQYQTPRPGPGSTTGTTPTKPVPKCTTKVRPMPPPLSGATVSVPMSSASGSGSGSGSYGQQQQPSLAPAKPKEKAVIDLTDEDDAAAAAAAKAAQAQIEANARLRQASNAAVKRSAQTAAATRGGRGGGNVVRASPMQLGRVNARQLVQNNGGGQRSSLGSNVTMQIRSENTPPAASRLRYSHPAPLPSSPAQPFNPAWKVPPSRPVIRINLLDTGIVISWTLEDTSPRFAECVTYQIYAYQETIHEPSTDSWRHVGDVNAMLLPMAVTLNQFQENQRYYFAVRGVDKHQRFGPFSVPKTWS
ncbi:enolase-phosphatase E1 [Drosophila suzukii]|uniref:Enolase-phosphatase E1 n=1 Tax=Drosophila suzukii TaxID=28584 RepID=A0AB39Z7G9_DROSZ